MLYWIYEYWLEQFKAGAEWADHVLFYQHKKRMGHSQLTLTRTTSAKERMELLLKLQLVAGNKVIKRYAINVGCPIRVIVPQLDSSRLSLDIFQNVFKLL